MPATFLGKLATTFDTPNRTMREKVRVLLSSREETLRLGRCTALAELRLPTGFHALSAEHRRRLLEQAFGDALEAALVEHAAPRAA